MFFESESAAPQGELVVAAGTAKDLPAIEGWLAELPANAYGQVLIESDSSLGAVAAPAGVTVHRICLGIEPGEGLARAVNAWLDEWVWVEADIDRSVRVWACDEPVPAMRECWGRFDRKIARRRFAAGATAICADSVAEAATSSLA